jgi:hypothetical protein
LARQANGLRPAKYQGISGFSQADANNIKLENGAGSGNRTRIASLEGWCFTTKLYPQLGQCLPAPYATELPLGQSAERHL